MYVYIYICKLISYYIHNLNTQLNFYNINTIIYIYILLLLLLFYFGGVLSSHPGT